MNLKNPLVIVGVVFLLFFLISQPLGLAALILGILAILQGFGESIVSFVQALF